MSSPLYISHIERSSWETQAAPEIEEENISNHSVPLLAVADVTHALIPLLPSSDHMFFQTWKNRKTN